MSEHLGCGGGNGQQQAGTLRRRESKLPLAADSGELVVAAVPGQLLVDSNDGSRGRLLIAMQRLSQTRQALAEHQHLVQRGGVFLVPGQTLSPGPASERSRIGEEVGWRLHATARGVDEVEPDGVAQQREFRLK